MRIFLFGICIFLLMGTVAWCEDASDESPYHIEAQIYHVKAGPSKDVAEEAEVDEPILLLQKKKGNGEEGKMDLDITLDLSVSIKLEDIHIYDLLVVLTEEYEISFLIDDGVVQRKEIDLGDETKQVDSVISDGIIKYVDLIGVSLREALSAILRPLNLDFKVMPGYVRVSTPAILNNNPSAKQKVQSSFPSSTGPAYKNDFALKGKKEAFTIGELQWTGVPMGEGDVLTLLSKPRIMSRVGYEAMLQVGANTAYEYMALSGTQVDGVDVYALKTKEIFYGSTLTVMPLRHTVHDSKSVIINAKLSVSSPSATAAHSLLPNTYLPVGEPYAKESWQNITITLPFGTCLALNASTGPGESILALIQVDKQ